MNITQLLIAVFCVIVLNWLWDMRQTNNSPLTANEELQAEAELNKKKKTDASVKVFLITLVMIPLGIILWISNGWFETYNKAKETLDWQESNGIVVEKNVKVFNEGQVGKGVGFRAPKPLLVPEVIYKYKTRDDHDLEQERISNTIGYLNISPFNDEEDVKKYLEQFPEVGQSLIIYTKQTKDKHGFIIKSESVLKPGTKGTEYLGISISGFFILLLLLIIKKIIQA